MQFKSSALLLSLLACGALSAPVEKRALTLQAYNDLSISAGTAGNAQAEALAKIPIDMNDLAGVSADDLQTLQTERESAEDAETDAFNPAIDAATDDATKTALQNGKIKNKVLKLQLEVTGLQIQQAQGKDTSAQIDEEMTKLNTNIGLDQDAAGQESQAVQFDG
ncbi:MAG: hypothetical protein Q9227_003374 [Pyrenula ochraceoflavens]